ncbi:D-arginine dehydrogenase [Rhodococcus sp. SORGH_AS 301]|nr:D-arginine dehydrogenase [Rhodococcus sp. SORGH_AS_0301]
MFECAHGCARDGVPLAPDFHTGRLPSTAMTTDAASRALDVLVIGGGIAGASLAWELSSDRTVCLLEGESTLAMHSTGRSAAMFLETYGNHVIRGLTTASRAFLVDPPDMVRGTVMTPRPFVQFARPGRGDALAEMFTTLRTLSPDARLLETAEAVDRAPLLRPAAVEAAVVEPGALDMDVDALHQGFLRGARRRGCTVRTGARVVAIDRVGEQWRVDLSTGDTLVATVVVNAAGAWADDLADLAGVPRIGLQPRRRTIAVMDAPPEIADTHHPLISDMDESFYIKPEGVRLLCSPADETPCPPGDAKPDDLEIARALDEITEATVVTSRRVRSSWAGLRSFVADRTPVVGFDPSVEGFFWCAGQGGYGIQTCAALARVGAALVRGEPLPADVTDRGVTAEDLAPGRLR